MNAGRAVISRRLQPPAKLARRRAHVTDAFTTVEVLVAAAILVVTIVAVTSVFTISSDTTSRTAAHSDLLAASAAIQQRLAGLLARIEPGMLIIESPPPTGPRGDVADGQRLFRMRHDRLVLIAAGEPGKFQSFTDPRRGTPDDPVLTAAESAQALVYIGPGVPLSTTGQPRLPQPFDNDALALPGAEWVLAQRAILLVLAPPNPALPGWTPYNMQLFSAAGGVLSGGALPDEYRIGRMDVVVSAPGIRADGSTLVDLLLNVGWANIASANTAVAALWEPSVCPVAVSLVDPSVADDGDYYVRTGANFQPRLADFRIEWTDGRRVDPEGLDGDPNNDFQTRWFGLRPDPADTPDIMQPGNLSYLAVMRQSVAAETTAEEAVAFGVSGGTNLVEWSPNGGASSLTARYRAVWRADTWQFRPTALRFTYRLYDTGNRLKQLTEIDLDEDGDFDPDDGGGPDQNRHRVMRFGQAFSFVLPLP